MRAFGFVRSEAELDQLAYELYEQEEVRLAPCHPSCHPPSSRLRTAIVGRMLSFLQWSLILLNILTLMVSSTCIGNAHCHTHCVGVVKDPMALHKEGKVTNIWSEEEKRVFRDK